MAWQPSSCSRGNGSTAVRLVSGIGEPQSGQNICCNEYIARRILSVSRATSPFGRYPFHIHSPPRAYSTSSTTRLSPKFCIERIRSMKRLAIAAGILALAAPLAMAQTSATASTWVSDPVHSEVDFTISHLAISNVHGRFGKVAATLVYDQADVTKSMVTATID